MYQKSCGRIVSHARCLPRRLKMYPTIEALRQTSEAGVLPHPLPRSRGMSEASGLVTEFDEGYNVRRGRRIEIRY